MTNEIKRTAAHTPGPWTVDSDRYGTFVRAVQTGNAIIDVHEPLTVASGEAPTAEQRHTLEANAHLIAAAPALLEALEQALTFLHEMDAEGFVVDDAEAAIRAARGEA